MKNVTIALPVINETFSLEKTVDIILAENDDILEIVIVFAERTTPESRQMIKKLKEKYPEVKTHLQNLPFLGGALREVFELAQGEYTLMMASDLETDPHDVAKLIKEIKKGEAEIVTASRWIAREGFKGYHPVKYFLNYIFQKIFSMIYFTHLTDMTYGFRIFKTEILKKIEWEELKHPFFFEALIKPLRLGYQATEIPSKWETRQEGESQNTFWANFKYFKIGLKTRFINRRRLLKKNYQDNF